MNTLGEFVEAFKRVNPGQSFSAVTTAMEDDMELSLNEETLQFYPAVDQGNHIDPARVSIDENPQDPPEGEAPVEMRKLFMNADELLVEFSSAIEVKNEEGQYEGIGTVEKDDGTWIAYAV